MVPFWRAAGEPELGSSDQRRGHCGWSCRCAMLPSPAQVPAGGGACGAGLRRCIRGADLHAHVLRSRAAHAGRGDAPRHARARPRSLQAAQALTTPAAPLPRSALCPVMWLDSFGCDCCALGTRLTHRDRAAQVRCAVLACCVSIMLQRHPHLCLCCTTVSLQLLRLFLTRSAPLPGPAGCGKD